jgi:hypothetical protein
MMAVAIETEPTLTLGQRASLFDTTPYILTDGPRHVALAPDGQRFLMLEQVGESEDAAPSPSIVVVQNWRDELERLVPTA